MLGAEDGERAAALLGVTAAGTFEEGASTLRLPADPDDPAWWAAARARLLAARTTRPQPARDDKVVTAWNGLAVAALAETGRPARPARPRARRPRRPPTTSSARTTSTACCGARRAAGVVSGAPAVLDDHGDLAEGLLALHQATGEARWLDARRARSSTRALARFVDAAGTVHDTAHDAPGLFARPANRSDNAEPSGAAALAGALLTRAALTGSAADREAAERALAAAGSVAAARAPVRRVGPRRRRGRWRPGRSRWRSSVTAPDGRGPARRRSGPVPPPGSCTWPAPRTPPASRCSPSGRWSTGGAAAYVCRGFVCDRPVTDVEALRAALARA